MIYKDVHTITYSCSRPGYGYPGRLQKFSFVLFNISKYENAWKLLVRERAIQGLFTHVTQAKAHGHVYFLRPYIQIQKSKLKVCQRDWCPETVRLVAADQVGYGGDCMLPKSLERYIAASRKVEERKTVLPRIA